VTGAVNFNTLVLFEKPNRADIAEAILADTMMQLK